MSYILSRNIQIDKIYEIYGWLFQIIQEVRENNLDASEIVHYCMTHPLPLDPDTATDIQGPRPYGFDDPDVHKIITRQFRRMLMMRVMRERIRDAFEVVFGVDMYMQPYGASDYDENDDFSYEAMGEPGTAPRPRWRFAYEPGPIAFDTHGNRIQYGTHAETVTEEPSSVEYEMDPGAPPDEPRSVEYDTDVIGPAEEPERVEYGINIRGILHALYERLAMLERAYVMMYEHL